MKISNKNIMIKIKIQKKKMTNMYFFCKREKEKKIKRLSVTNHPSFTFTRCTRKSIKWKARFGHWKALHAPSKKRENHHALIVFRCKKIKIQHKNTNISLTILEITNKPAWKDKNTRKCMFYFIFYLF
jgi:hypothetical protein